MQNRLSGRGLVLALGIVAVLLASPTPVPQRVVKAWTAAQTAALTGDTLSAEQALSDLQLSSVWLPALKPGIVRLALANGSGELALGLLEASPVPQAPMATIQCWRAEALALLGKWEKAAEALSSIEAATCTTPRPILKALADRELDSNDLPAATSILRRLASLYPQEAETSSLLGACLALEDPASAPSILQLAASKGDSLAIDLAAALGRVPPGDPSAALAASGEIFLQHSVWPLAAESFRRLVTLEPANAMAHAYQGLALDQQGLDGLADLEAAVRLDPSSAAVQSLLGLHWQLQGQPQKAIPYLEVAVELDPENGAFRASLAAARAGTGDVQAAIAEYRQAADSERADPAFWRLLAAFSIAQEFELSDTGLPAARNAVVLDPEDPTSFDLAGYAHFLLGDLVTAERLTIRSLELDPTSASARLHYGLLLSATGRTREARLQLTAAVSLGGASPSGQSAQRALSQLGE
jgi:Flp pilus assembly protein TadD